MTFNRSLSLSAQEMFERGIKLALELEDSYNEAYLRYELGQLLIKQGLVTDGVPHIEKAIELFSMMQMTAECEKSQALLDKHVGS